MLTQAQFDIENLYSEVDGVSQDLKNADGRINQIKEDQSLDEADIK